MFLYIFWYNVQKAWEPNLIFVHDKCPSLNVSLLSVSGFSLVGSVYYIATLHWTALLIHHGIKLKKKKSYFILFYNIISLQRL